MSPSAETYPETSSGISVSVVIPTLNEAENVALLTERLARALAGKTYELIFIDDHSDDGTLERLQQLQAHYPIIARTKQGKPGKAFSLLEGFGLARYEYVAIIDADLQYPP